VLREGFLGSEYSSVRWACYEHQPKLNISVKFRAISRDLRLPLHNRRWNVYNGGCRCDLVMVFLHVAPSKTSFFLNVGIYIITVPHVPEGVRPQCGHHGPEKLKFSVILLLLRY